MTVSPSERSRVVIGFNVLTRGNAGAPGGIRTPNLLIRSQMLYPLSHGCWAAGQLAGRLRRVSLARLPTRFPSTSGRAPVPPVHRDTVPTSSRSCRRYRARLSGRGPA